MKLKRKSFIFIGLLIILWAVILSRWAGFAKNHSFTLDETLYVQLGLQLNSDPSNYSTQTVYEHCAKNGQFLPDYLNKPLFKHPPLFSYLISLFNRLFGPSYSSAFFVSLASGLVIIIMTYCAGAFLFNRYTGLLAALLVALDPIHWMCSQKIWMETTYAAFFWISLVFLIKAIFDGGSKYFIWAGVSTGLAILTKYPAFLIFPVGFTCTLFYNKKLFKLAYFWLWPLISFVLFVPWIVWNGRVYKAGFLAEMVSIKGSAKGNFYQIFSVWSLIIAAGAIIAFFIYNGYLKKYRVKPFNPRRAVYIIIAAGLILLFSRSYMTKGLVNMLNINYVPPCGWEIGMFAREPWYFYLRRLIELSPFYMISILGLFLLPAAKSKASFLYITAFWIMFTAICQGNFQSRYILTVVPALMIISANVIIRLIEVRRRFVGKGWLGPAYAAALTLVLAYCFLKVLFVDSAIAWVNSVCYF